MSVTNRSGLFARNAVGTYRDQWRELRGRRDRHYAEAVVLEPPVQQALVNIALRGSEVKYEAPITGCLLRETVRVVDGREVRGSEYLLTAVVENCSSDSYDASAGEAFDRAVASLDTLSSASEDGHDFAAVPRAYLGSGAVAVHRELAGVTSSGAAA